VVQKSGGACPVVVLLLMPVKPSISQMIQASEQKEVIAGVPLHMVGCASTIVLKAMIKINTSFTTLLQFSIKLFGLHKIYLFSLEYV
jgi:hypothetical protein